MKSSKNDKIIYDLIKKFAEIDAMSKKISKLSGKRQTIIFDKEYDFEVLNQLNNIFKNASRLLTGSFTLTTKSCTIRLYRIPDDLKIK